MERLDKVLLNKGLVDSREKAKALIMAGKVLVDGKVMDKPGTKLTGTESIEIQELPRYVSRGGYKLEGALRRFGIEPAGWVALDVGSSTGGFTHCLLEHGVRKVYAVDVGRGQLDYRLRKDPRVVLYEKTDARALSEEHIPDKVDLITVDVSFISVTKVLPSIYKFLKEDGLMLILVKPQFELCPRKVKKGIVREKEHRREALTKVAHFLTESGFSVLGIVKSFPKGTKGNEEFFILASKMGKSVDIAHEVEKSLEEEEGI